MWMVTFKLNDLGYSRVDGTSKMNDAKLAEIKDRKSM